MDLLKLSAVRIFQLRETTTTTTTTNNNNNVI